jgi:hypothetical protein
MLTFREAQDIRSGYTKDSNALLEFVDIIQGDLYRTFPSHPQFTSASSSPTIEENNLLSHPPMIQSLRRILVAFAYYSWPHPDESRRPARVCSYTIGYCQGLNAIAALLLLVYTHDLSLGSVEEWLSVEEQVFWTLVALVELLLPSQVYGKSLKGAQVQQQILWLWIIKEHGESFGLKDVSDWMVRMVRSGDSLASLQSITTSWFMNLFINVLPMDSVLRVLDCFFYQGEKTLYRVSVSLLQLHQKYILGFDNVGDACTFIKNMPKKMINAHLVLQHCFVHVNSSTLFVEDEVDPEMHWIPLGSPRTFIQRDSMEKIDHHHASRLNNGVISDCRTFLSRYASTRSLDSNV